MKNTEDGARRTGFQPVAEECAKKPQSKEDRLLVCHKRSIANSQKFSKIKF
jgi:hypothetical protein